MVMRWVMSGKGCCVMRWRGMLCDEWRGMLCDEVERDAV